MSKGSRNRVSNHKRYRSNHDRIFKRHITPIHNATITIPKRQKR
jgi:hypothetical protein